MTTKLPAIILKKGKEQSLLRFHPWVFSGAIKSLPPDVEEGDAVEIFDSSGEYLATGHYQIGSIAVRIFSFERINPDAGFWKKKIAYALDLRRMLNFTDNPETNVFRLIHGEGDGLPGWVADYYNGVAVLQFHSVGMYRIRSLLAQQLGELLGEKLVAVYDKSSKTLPFKAPISPVDGYIWGEKPVQSEVREYGLKFCVDWEEGQKTGFFIDQRENRNLLRQMSAGRHVLNMFCYTGGFSVAALQGGAASVHSVDSSQKAIDLTLKNVALNFPGDNRHEVFAVDAFSFLSNIRDKYDLIVLDPPAFAKHRDALGQALQGYKRLNVRAFEQIKQGGIVFTFSCSQIVSREKFREAVFSAAAISKRKVRIIHQLTQPADHPVDIYHPEGEYLKGLVLYVEN